MKRLIQILFLLIFVCQVGATGASAKIEGMLEWGYANFDGESDMGDIEASHFTQRYSVMYKEQGLLAGGRAGFYDIGVGGEWASMDSSFNDQDVDKDSWKYMYEGRVSIAPGALPFRLNAYSYDTNRITFEKVNSLFRYDGASPEALYFPFRPNFVGDINNGQTIVTGLQLMAGIRNGRYLGNYREMLSKWPRLLIDYRDLYHKDTKNENKSNYRDRNLAFISLNKKDNWFHYRLREFTDYIHSDNNWDEKSFLLGTIDHTNKRHWINMTNWIKVSVDGSYSELRRSTDENPTETYETNFFTLMKRNGLSGASFAHMERSRRGGYLEKKLDVPVIFSKVIDPDTTLHSRVQVWRRSQENGVLLDEQDESYYGKALLRMQQNRQIQYDSSLEAELVTGNVRDGSAVRARLEARTNPLLRKKLGWFGSASVAFFEGTDSNDRDIALGEIDLLAGGEYRLRPNVRIGGNQKLLFGQGEYGTSVTRFMGSEVMRGFASDIPTPETSAADVSVFRSYSSLYLETISSRLHNRYEFIARLQSRDSENLHAIQLNHHLRYQTKHWRITWKNRFETGDDGDFGVPNTNYLGWVNDAGEYSDMFRSRLLVSYDPNRYWSNSLEAMLTYGIGDDENKLIFTGKQELVRNFYALSSVKRKLGDITQGLVYEQALNGIEKKAVVFSLYGNYRPRTHWSIGGGFEYQYYDFAEDMLTFSFTTGVDFPLFRLDFSYDFGMTDYQDTVAHRYEVNMSKTF